MASKGYGWTYNGAWQFVTADDRSVWSTAWNNFMPRFGVNYRLADNSVLRFAYARFRMPLSNLRDTLGRLRQPVHRLRADHQHARALQRAAAAGAERPVPGHQPGPGGSGPDPGPLHRSRQRRQLRPVRDPAAAERPLQRLVPAAALGRHGPRRVLLLQLRLARALPRQPEHARPGVHLRAGRAAQHAGAEPVPQLPDARNVPGRAAQQHHGARSAACSCPIRSTARSPRPTSAPAAT